MTSDLNNHAKRVRQLLSQISFFAQVDYANSRDYLRFPIMASPRKSGTWGTSSDVRESRDFILSILNGVLGFMSAEGLTICQGCFLNHFLCISGRFSLDFPCSCPPTKNHAFLTNKHYYKMYSLVAILMHT